MDPKQPVRPPIILDDKPVPGVADSGKGKTYIVRTILNDGTIRDEYKRYSGQGPENDPVIKVDESGVDETQQKIFLDQQKAAAPTATSQETAKRDTITVDGRVKQWNPETSRYDIDVGAAGTGQAASGPAQERAAQEQVERRRNSQAVGIPLTDVEKAQWDVARQKEQDAKDEKARADIRQERLDIENRAQRIWSQGVQERQLTGQEDERKRVAGLQERDQQLQENAPIKTEHGIFRPVRDQSGAVVSLERIPGGEGAPPPDLGALKAELGNIVPELQGKWQELLQAEKDSGGQFTHQDALKEFIRLHQVAEARSNEITNILNAQQNVRSQDITQRGNTLTNISGRQNMAQTAFSNAVQAVTGMRGPNGMPFGAPPGVSASGAIRDLMGLQKEYAQGIGALRDVPEVPQTPLQQSVMGINPAGMVAGAGQGGTPISININTGGGAPNLSGLVPQMSVGQEPFPTPGQTPTPQMPDPSNAPPMPTSMSDLFSQEEQNAANDPDRMAALQRIKQEVGLGNRSKIVVPGGMRYAGGQLRAPGYSAGV